MESAVPRGWPRLFEGSSLRALGCSLQGPPQGPDKTGPLSPVETACPKTLPGNTPQ